MENEKIKYIEMSDGELHERLNWLLLHNEKCKRNSEIEKVQL